MLIRGYLNQFYINVQLPQVFLDGQGDGVAQGIFRDNQRTVKTVRIIRICQVCLCLLQIIGAVISAL